MEQLDSNNMRNLTKDRYVEKIQGIVLDFQSVKENIIDEILCDTPFKNISTLFYDRPFSGWNEEERVQVLNMIKSRETELISIVSFAYDYDKTIFKFYGDDPSAVVSGIIRNIKFDMNSNNFEGAANNIGYIEDVFNRAIVVLRDQCPDIDLDIPNNASEQIEESSTKFDVQCGTNSSSVVGYKTKDYADADAIDFITNATSDISIIESNGNCYICSNNSEVNKLQIAYAYLQIDACIPEQILEDISLSSKYSEYSLSSDALSELKKQIELPEQTQQQYLDNQDNTPTTEEALEIIDEHSKEEEKKLSQKSGLKL